MKKLKVYLDTSILNFALGDDTPKEQAITLKFFDQIEKYEPYISNIVLAEVNRCPDPKKQKMLNLVTEYSIETLVLDESARALAQRYIQQGIIPQKYRDDAFHIAIASVNNTDVILSWNFEHIVKLKTKREVVAINLLMGYKEIDIYSPMEVVENV